MENSMRFPKILKLELADDAAIPLLGLYPEKTIIGKDTCTPMFIEALFTIAMTLKELRCPLTDEWIKKMSYKYTMEYYSASKKNGFNSILERWMKLQPAIWSEVSHKEKNKYRILMQQIGFKYEKEYVKAVYCHPAYLTSMQSTS